MRIKISPDDASVLDMGNWIAELRADDPAEPVADGGPAPEAAAVAPPAACPAGSTGNGACASNGARALPAERAAIGDQLRIPIARCEMGSCISRHTDPAALGEADIRARAISAGWRLDGLGRLACPTCQQSGSGFWASHPVALWDRNVAITRAYLMTTVMRNRSAGDSAGRASPPAPPLSPLD